MPLVPVLYHFLYLDERRGREEGREGEREGGREGYRRGEGGKKGGDKGERVGGWVGGREIRGREGIWGERDRERVLQEEGEGVLDTHWKCTLSL